MKCRLSSKIYKDNRYMDRIHIKDASYNSTEVSSSCYQYSNIIIQNVTNIRMYI